MPTLCRRLRRNWRVPLVPVVLLLVAVPSVACGPRAFAGDGPLHDYAGAYGVDVPASQVGATFTDGVTLLRIEELDAPITLLSATPVISEGSPLEPLGAGVRLLHGPHETYLPGWPPDVDDLAEVNGFVIPVPTAGKPVYVNIMFGYRLTATAGATRDGLIIEYEYRGRRYHVKYSSVFHVMAPGESPGS